MTFNALSSRGIGNCENCRDRAILTECRFLYSGGTSGGRYRDLCEGCQRGIQALRQQFIKPPDEFPPYRRADATQRGKCGALDQTAGSR